MPLLAVRHPANVHCLDLLSDEVGRVYLIMEIVEGISLSKKMNDGPLSPDDVAVLGARVSHGLSAAHRKGVIHRDVSPDNIVLPNGRVQEAELIDFGIAKILQEGEGHDHRWLQGQALLCLSEAAWLLQRQD